MIYASSCSLVLFGQSACISPARSLQRTSAVIAVCSIVMACQDALPTASRSLNESPPLSATVEEGSALQELSRLLAMTLNDSAARRQLLSDLKQRGVGSELKLVAEQLLLDRSPGSVHSRLLQQTQLTFDSVRALVGRVRALELYMPVREHRAIWNGDEVLVAFQLNREDPIRAFDSSGDLLTLSATAVPGAPTVALVPLEFDANQSFAALVAPDVSSLRCRSQKVLQPCAADPPVLYDINGDGIPDNAPSGLYMTYSWVMDLKEPWIRGDPEIEAHVLGPALSDAANDLRSISCASSSSPASYRFDQNGHTWSGSVLLLDGAQFDTYRYADGEADERSLLVYMYEDDDTTCQIKEDPNRLRYQIEALVFWGTVGWFVQKACKENTVGGNTCGMGIWGTIIMLGRVLWSFGTNNDDYLGMAIEKDDVPNFTDANSSHALVLDASQQPFTLNGGVRLVYHQTYIPPPPPVPPPTIALTGPNTVKPDVTCGWEVSVTSGAGPFRYTWLKDGDYAGGEALMTASLSAPVTFGVTVFDVYGQNTYASKSVTVSSAAGPCLF